MLSTEGRRSWLALAVAVATLAPITALGGFDPGDDATSVLVGMAPQFALYQTAYVLLTVALLAHPWEQLARWGEDSREATWVQRYVYVREPGAGLAVGVAFIALLYAGGLVVAPTRNWVTLSSILVLLAASWLTILLSFALDYLRTDGRHGWSQLDIPGAAPSASGRTLSDYVYFATSVSTTFGTTDVTVLTSRMRKTVAIHGAVAFVFNTIVLAIAVGALGSLASARG